MLDTQWDRKTERRSGKDRRKSVLWGLPSALIHQKRRRHVRRAADRRRIVMLDQYSGSIMMMMVLVLLLSIVDAMLTLFLIEHGAVELNPVMDYYLKKGPPTFVIVKYLLTATSGLIIVMSHYVSIPYINIMSRNLLKVFATGFAAIISWELYLTFRFVL